MNSAVLGMLAGFVAVIVATFAMVGLCMLVGEVYQRIRSRS